LSKGLVIVESPAKAKTIQKYLGKGFTVDASYGHVKDLPKSSLGVDLENDFETEYVVIPGKESSRSRPTTSTWHLTPIGKAKPSPPISPTSSVKTRARKRKAKRLRRRSTTSAMTLAFAA
jgi:hypothetical protein